MSARLERVDEDLEAGRVARQLEQSHDADDAKELEDVVILLEIIEQEVEVETERRDEVDDINWSKNERAFARTDHKPDTVSVM